MNSYVCYFELCLVMDPLLVRVFLVIFVFMAPNCGISWGNLFKAVPLLASRRWIMIIFRV